jgi:tRNA pseudouridine(55) synthase
MTDGILLLNKQPGETSTGCVEKIRRLFGKKRKVGHGGTLDSPASGLLVLLVGAATRSCPFVQLLPKVYLVEAQLGAFSDTDDASGHIEPREDWGAASPESVVRELTGFLGLRLQVPPSISAVHVAGRRAHQLARSGEKTALSSKPVTITSFSDFSGPDVQGRVRFKIQCHKGTYVRSLVRDLGNRLGCGAYVVSLQRLSIGRFGLEQAHTMSRLTADTRESLLPIDALLDHFVAYRVPQEMETDVRNGRPIPCDCLHRLHWGLLPESGHVVLRTRNLASFALPEGRTSHYRPDVVLALGDQA